MMNREELAESFEDACKGDRVFQWTKDKLSRRLDLHAMMLLDRLVPDTIDIIIDEKGTREAEVQR